MVELTVIEGSSEEASQKTVKIDKRTRRMLGVGTGEYVKVVGSSGDLLVKVLKVGMEFINQGKAVLSKSVMQHIGVSQGSRINLYTPDAPSTSVPTISDKKTTIPSDIGDVSTLWGKKAKSFVDPEDVVLVMDSSGSMSESAGLSPGVTKIQAVMNATSAFLDIKTGMAEGDVVALVAFTADAQTMEGLTTNYASISAAAQKLNPNNGTSLEAGIREGYRVLDGGKSPQKRIIMLTDGYGGDPTNMVRKRNKGESGIRIDTVGVGSSLNADILKEIAAMTGGKYVFVSDMDTLKDEFRKMSDDKGL